MNCNFLFAILILLVECQIGALAAPSQATHSSTATTFSTGEFQLPLLLARFYPSLLFSLPTTVMMFGMSSSNDTVTRHKIYAFAKSICILMFMSSIGPTRLTSEPKLNHWIALIITNELAYLQQSHQLPQNPQNPTLNNHRQQLQRHNRLTLIQMEIQAQASIQRLESNNEIPMLKSSNEV